MDAEAVAEVMAKVRLEPRPEWGELLERGICPRCGEEIRFIRISRGREVYARHSGRRSCYLATVGRLESAGVDIEAVRSAIAARRREGLSRWVEVLAQGVCPRCGGRVKSVRKMGSRQMTALVAVHDDGRLCYLVSVRKLEKVLGLDVGELLGRLPRARPKMLWKSPEVLREWLETLRQGVCPRCGREVLGVSISWRKGGVSVYHGQGRKCYIASIGALKAAGAEILELLKLKRARAAAARSKAG